MGPLFGKTFHLIFILLNMVMLVNLVIAVLSETFYRLNIQRLGLYYDGVIEVIPAYKYKKFYGALIAACPPFNLLVLPFLPIFAFTRQKKKVRNLNNILVKLIFFPFALIYSGLFCVGNLLMLVPAFCLTVYRKFKLLLRNGDDTQRRSLIVNFVTFLIFGAFFMSISLFVDIYYFIAHLYTFNNNAISSGFVSAISAEAFNTLEAVV